MKFNRLTKQDLGEEGEYRKFQSPRQLKDM